jgi:hypothetical protein
MPNHATNFMVQLTWQSLLWRLLLTLFLLLALAGPGLTLFEQVTSQPNPSVITPLGVDR